ncbi:L-type lectin-domain containing protein [Portibacter marinus]|uniref:L-type lectin-domain containing protein n=1 Tax=Portibacter marinus TaxID=2898660 RepID=UPI001F36229A|nr:L-type lectin-domain containing protein [Portibacter marinus]
MKFVFLTFLIGFTCSVFSQTKTFDFEDFYLLGDAVAHEQSSIRLTDNLHNQKGAMWYKDAIDLNKPFLLEFKVFFGCSDGGADGLVFALHPEIALGTHDFGIGFKGLSPSFGVEMDTYQDYYRGDPHFDHAAFIANGNTSHHLALTEAVPLYSYRKSVENCQWHYVTFKWEPKTKVFSFYVDFEHRLSREIDLVNLIFEGSSNVFWGFTSATGMHRNPHHVFVNFMRFEAEETFVKKDAELLLAGESYELKKTEFALDSMSFMGAIRPELEKVVLLQKSNPEQTIIIDGFSEADNNGEKSQKNVEWIRNYFIKRGIPEQFVTFYGSESGEKERITIRMKVIRA